MACLYVNRIAHVACSFGCLLETGELLKIRGNQVHVKSGNISQTVPHRGISTTDH